MTEQTFYRSADIAKGDAVKQLLAANPGATIVRVDAKRAAPAEARFAGVRTGDEIFAATIRYAEDEGESKDESDDKPADDSSKDSGPPKDVDVDLDIAPDSGGEDKGGDAPEGLEGLGDEGGEPEKELTGEDKIIDLLTQLVDAVKGGGDLGAPDDLGADPALGGDLPPGGDASVLPDIGSPVPGGELPPPVPPKAGPGGPAFASVQSKVASAGSAELVLRDVTTAVKTRDIVEQAQKDFPGHKVARVRRNGTVEIKGTPVDLPAHEIALVTLVRK